MSAEKALVRRSFRVGTRICTLTIPQPKGCNAVSMVAEWTPDLPDSGLTESELAAYRAGRALVVAELSRVLGVEVGVFELGGGAHG